MALSKTRHIKSAAFSLCRASEQDISGLITGDALAKSGFGAGRQRMRRRKMERHIFAARRQHIRRWCQTEVLEHDDVAMRAVMLLRAAIGRQRWSCTKHTTATLMRAYYYWPASVTPANRAFHFWA